MKKVAVICEYNPFHKGHKYQLSRVREIFPDSGIITIMSPSFVQRGLPAIFDKFARGECAIRGGADLALSMPQVFALLSAEGFAEGGVKLAKNLGANAIVFGAENDELEALKNAARALIDPSFDACLKEVLGQFPNLPYPAARQKALERTAGKECADIITTPNNILAVEYIKAGMRYCHDVEFCPIKREGNAHSDRSSNGDILSATAIREMIVNGRDWHGSIPEEILKTLINAQMPKREKFEDMLFTAATLADREKLIRSTGSKELADTVYISSKKQADFKGFRESLSRKKFTETRIDRALINILLDIGADEFLHAEPLYASLLGMSGRGREIASELRKSDTILISRPSEYKKFFKDGECAQIEKELLADRIWARCLENPRSEEYFINKRPFLKNDC